MNRIYLHESSIKDKNELLTDSYINYFLQNKMEAFIEQLPRLYTFGCLNALAIISENENNHYFLDYEGWKSKGYSVIGKPYLTVNQIEIANKEIKNWIKSMDYGMKAHGFYQVGRYLIINENGLYKVEKQFYKNKAISQVEIGTFERKHLKSFFQEKVIGSIIGYQKMELWSEEQIERDKTRPSQKVLYPFEIYEPDGQAYLMKFQEALHTLTQYPGEEWGEINIKKQLTVLAERYAERFLFCPREYRNYVTETVCSILLKQYHIADENMTVSNGKIYEESLRNKVDILQNIFIISHSISKVVYDTYAGILRKAKRENLQFKQVEQEKKDINAGEILLEKMKQKIAAENVRITIWKVKSNLYHLKNHSYFSATILKKIFIQRQNYDKIIELEMKKIDDMSSLPHDILLLGKRDANLLSEYAVKEGIAFPGIDISDVITINCNGKSISYYVNEDSLHPFNSFDKERGNGRKENQGLHEFYTLYAHNPVLAIVKAGAGKIGYMNAKIMALIDSINLPMPDSIGMDSYLKKGNEIAKKILNIGNKIVFQICVSDLCDTDYNNRFHVYTEEDLKSIQGRLPGAVINTFIICNDEIYLLSMEYKENDNTLGECIKRNLRKQIKNRKYYLQNACSDEEKYYIRKQLKELKIIAEILKERY